MSISRKLKDGLRYKAVSTTYLADFFGITIQAIRNKFVRGSFSVEDLIIYAESLDYEVVLQSKGYENDGGFQVKLGTDDIPEESAERIKTVKTARSKARQHEIEAELQKMTPAEREALLKKVMGLAGDEKNGKDIE